jgi:hypothetical protein
MFLSRRYAAITHGFLSEPQNNQVTYVDHKGNLQPPQLLKEKKLLQKLEPIKCLSCAPAIFIDKRHSLI